MSRRRLIVSLLLPLGLATAALPFEASPAPPQTIAQVASQWAQSNQHLSSILWALELNEVHGRNLENAHACSLEQLRYPGPDGSVASLMPTTISVLGDQLVATALCARPGLEPAISFDLKRPRWFDAPGKEVIDGSLAGTVAALGANKVTHTWNGRGVEDLLSLVVFGAPGSADWSAFVVYPAPLDGDTTMRLRKIKGSSDSLQTGSPSLDALPVTPSIQTPTPDSEASLIAAFNTRVKGAGRNLHDFSGVTELAQVLLQEEVAGVSEEWRAVSTHAADLRAEATTADPRGARAGGTETWEHLFSDLVAHAQQPHA